MMWRILQIEENAILADVDNILRDQHNSANHTKGEFNNCFIIHSKYFSTNFTSSETIWPISRLGFRIQTDVFFFLSDAPQNVDNIHRTICFGYSFLSSVQFLLEIQLFCLWIAWTPLFSIHYCPSSFLSRLIYPRSTSFRIKYTIKPMLYKLLSSSKYDKRQLLEE